MLSKLNKEMKEGGKGGMVLGGDVKEGKEEELGSAVWTYHPLWRDLLPYWQMRFGTKHTTG